MKRREFLKVAGGSVAGIAALSILPGCSEKGYNSSLPPIPSGSKPTGHFEMWQLTSASDQIGNAYVLKTREGNLIIMDGGMETNGDAEKLRSWIKTQGGNKVKAWWLSHPHGDHIGAILAILEDLRGIEIENIYYSKLTGKALTCENSTNTLRLYNDFTEAEKRGTKVHDVTLGGRYDVDGILIKVLGIANPDLTTGYKNKAGGIGCGPYNDQSVILRVEDDAKSVVFLGDAGQGCGEKLFTVNSKYKKDLNCDYLQMAHHGQQGVKESFYKGITFKHCLWPTPSWVWKVTEEDYNNGTTVLETWRTRKWMDEIGIPAENHHVAWRDIDWHLA